MNSTFIRPLALIVWAALVPLMWTTAAGAANLPMSGCGTLTSSGDTYVLTADVSGGTCFTVAADDITLDMNGHSITAGVGVSDAGVARLNTIVKNSVFGNGQITASDTGIDLASSSHNQVLGVQVSASGFAAIHVGDHSLVKNCRVQGNADLGILITHDGQVQGCLVTMSPKLPFATPGIAGGDNLLITQNTVQSIPGPTLIFVGINVGNFSTVTHNQVSDSQVGMSIGDHATVNYNIVNNNHDGIGTGGHSSVAHNTANNNVAGGIAVGVTTPDTTNNTVTFNTTNNNGGVGLEVVCPSGVANNLSQGNAGGNYQFDGTGCITSNNK